MLFVDFSAVCCAVIGALLGGPNFTPPTNSLGPPEEEISVSFHRRAEDKQK